MVLFWTDVLATVMHIGLSLLAVPYFGLKGAGMAFVGLYLVHGCVAYVIVRRMSGFRWSAANKQVGRVIAPLLAGVFCGFLFLPLWLATLVGVLALLFSVGYSVRVLLKLVSAERIPRPIRQVMVWTKLARPEIL
jgi:PST family polysaccharide transporter